MQTRRDSLSRRSFLASSGSAMLLAACASQPETVPVLRGSTVTSLLAAQAVPIRTLTPEDPGVAALGKRLSKARLAGLGEATHGSHEDALLKSLLIQVMVENHDLRVVLLEANRAGSAQLDAYASGAPTGLRAAEAVKGAPVFNILKTEVIADLMTWLRGWNAVNADRRVRVVGVDCQASSVDAADALAALAGVDSGAADAISTALAPIITDEAKAARHDMMLKQITTAELRAAESACRTLEAELARAGLAEAAFTARRAWQGLNAFELEAADGDMALATPGYWSRRDGFMAENAITLATGQRAVFWGHNSHVGGATANGYIPSGAVLRTKLGHDYAVMTQDFAEATFLAIPASAGLAPDAEPVAIQRAARPGTLNALLSAASPRAAWFDVAGLPENSLIANWRKTPIGLEWYGASAGEEPAASDILEVSPDALADIMVIHPVLTPSRML